MNTAFLGPYTSLEIQNAAFISPGGVNWGDVSCVPSLLVVAVSAPPPFGIQFSSGVYAQAHGLVNGTDSSTYSLDFSSLVPGSGSATVYAVASAAQVGENPLQVVGPPPGHPDYDPTFTPTTDYTTTYDTLDIYATATAPDGTGTIEIFRTVLTSGQTSIASGNISYTNRATAYVTAPVYSVFGRAGAVLASSGDYAAYYGRLAVSNVWTAANYISTTSGGAANSPVFALQGWTGSAGIKVNFYTDSSGVLHIRQNTVASDVFTVDQSGNCRAYGTFIANSNITGAGTLGISGATALGSTLNLTGAAVFASTLGLSGAATLGSTFNLSGAATLASTFGVSGASSFGSTVSAASAVTFASTLGVSGAATVAGNLHVSGNINLAGVANIASTLGVSGNVTIGGSITSTGIGNFNTSARDFKENIRTIEHSVDKFMRLQPKSYTHLPTNLPTVGFMADDIDEIYPELVQYRSGKPYALNYTGIIPYLVAMVQEQESRIESLERQLKAN